MLLKHRNAVVPPRLAVRGFRPFPRHRGMVSTADPAVRDGLSLSSNLGSLPGS